MIIRERNQNPRILPPPRRRRLQMGYLAQQAAPEIKANLIASSPGVLATMPFVVVKTIDQGNAPVGGVQYNLLAVNPDKNAIEIEDADVSDDNGIAVLFSRYVPGGKVKRHVAVIMAPSGYGNPAPGIQEIEIDFKREPKRLPIGPQKTAIKADAALVKNIDLMFKVEKVGTPLGRVFGATSPAPTTFGQIVFQVRHADGSPAVMDLPAREDYPYNGEVIYGTAPAVNRGSDRAPGTDDRADLDALGRVWVGYGFGGFTTDERNLTPYPVLLKMTPTYGGGFRWYQRGKVDPERGFSRVVTLVPNPHVYDIKFGLDAPKQGGLWPIPLPAPWRAVPSEKPPVITPAPTRPPGMAPPAGAFPPPAEGMSPVVYIVGGALVVGVVIYFLTRQKEP